MQQHTFLQGSPEWHAHRANSKNAGDAPAMLGCSPYQSRQQLLHALHTGLRPEASVDQERIYAAGHAIEAAQRPGAEEFIGEELFPVVGSEQVEGLLLSASFDGLTMLADIVYECKTLNDVLRAAFADMQTIAPTERERAAGKCLPKHYRVQMEQQLAVCGGERVLFVAANKDGSDVRRCWYYPDAKLRAEIIAGWKQLDADLASYAPPSAAGMEKVAAEPVEALPAPMVQVTGQLTLLDNFKVFEERLRHFLEHRLIREPKTDQDFADLDLQIKAMKQAREALKAAEAQMLAQVQPVDQAKKTKDMLDKLLQQNCSMAETLLKDEKERRRGEIVGAGVKALADHVRKLDDRLQPVFSRVGAHYMPQVPADFGGCIRGLKSLASMEDKVATELARAKIAANEIADRIDANLKALRELASDHVFLFADSGSLVLKAPDDCRAVITSRIGEHRAAEERRAAELAERERARIRAEEEARAQRQQQEREAQERRQREEAEAAQRRQEQEAAAREQQEREQQPAAADHYLPASQAAVAPSPGVVPIRRPAAAPSGPPTLRIGEIANRLGFGMTESFLRTLGFTPSGKEGASKLYHEHEWCAICDALIAQIQAARDERREAA